MMEMLGIPPASLVVQSRKSDYYSDSDLSPYLIEDPSMGILRIPDSRPLREAVPTDDM